MTDAFCFACGNPGHSMIKEHIDEILDIYKEYLESPKNFKYRYFKKLMKQIDAEPNFLTKLKNLDKKAKWLNKCTILTVTDKIIHGCKDSGAGNEFEDSKGNLYYHDLHSGIYSDIPEKFNCGLLIHTDCWKTIKSQYKIDIKYSDVPAIYEKKEYYKVNSKIDYKVIDKYWGQNFNFVDIVLDSNEYICESPFTNNKNASRIKNILSQMKINTDLNRKGPSVSATFYTDKIIKYGLDKKLWIKSTGKWTIMKEPNEKLVLDIKMGKINPKQRIFLNRLVCIGEPSINKVFIIGMKELKSYTYKIEFFGQASDINIIRELFS